MNTVLTFHTPGTPDPMTHSVIPINLSGFKHRHLSCTSQAIKKPSRSYRYVVCCKIKKLIIMQYALFTFRTILIIQNINRLVFLLEEDFFSYEVRTEILNLRATLMTVNLPGGGHDCGCYWSVSYCRGPVSIAGHSVWYVGEQFGSGTWLSPVSRAPFPPVHDTYVHFMFMEPCIFIYEDHINNQRDATFYALYC